MSFLTGLSDDELEETFFGGRGRTKGKGKRGNRSTGKGKGRRGNPRDKDGNVMKCYVDGCGSTEHLARDCPKGKGRGKQILHAPILSMSMQSGKLHRV